ncbi:Thioredoxin-related protein [Mesonia phycicola]|uniref:Thioredoxin-related protein n=1 Tax=Mesonia phycicola TaxID=579105 RepID=A0A1M6EL44_9FLAO|nr:thioredoxin fold domain-containing protein [Mesonia phycicola]SHI86255.1 Thioredoxin-related protein [Mesonia phycicola]
MLTKKIFFLLLLCSTSTFAQSTVNWLRFEQLETSLQQETKPVLLFFYADWCAYCKKMEQNAFKNKGVIEQLNREFYVVKMNAETTEPITFDGSTFYNKEVEIKRNPTHQLAKLLASRTDKPFTLPAIVLLDESFKVINRKFTYLTSSQLIKFINYKR